MPYVCHCLQVGTCTAYRHVACLLAKVKPSLMTQVVDMFAEVSLATHTVLPRVQLSDLARQPLMRLISF